MTVSAVPFALQNVPINADMVRQAVSSLVPNGGGLVQAGDMAVTQLATPAMGVQVGVGRAWIDGTNLAHITGQGYGKQGMYFIMNDAAATVTISTADATNPRIDVIYAAVPDSAYAGTVNAPVIAVATGTPIAGATYPANAPSLPSNSIALAWIMVGANVTTITTSNITTITSNIASASYGLVAQANQSGGTSFNGAAELQVTSVSASLTAGRTYRLRASIDAASTLANTYVVYRLKYGGSGTGTTGTNTRGPYTAAYAVANTGQSFDICGQPWVAASSGSSLCIMTAQIVVATTATVSTGSGTPAPLSITVEDLG